MAVKGKVLTTVYLKEATDKKVEAYMENENRKKSNAIERLVEIALDVIEKQK